MALKRRQFVGAVCSILPNLMLPPWFSVAEASQDITAGNGSGPRILAFVFPQGGVGRTTAVINLAIAIAAMNKRVLIMDLDPRGTASTVLGIGNPGAYQVMTGDASLRETILCTTIQGVDIAPANIDLFDFEAEFGAMTGRETRLQKALAADAPEHDFILIDCPPNLGLLTINALVASHTVLIPLMGEIYILEGIKHMMKMVDWVLKDFNPGLDIRIAFTLHDRRNQWSDLVVTRIRRRFGKRVYSTVIPRDEDANRFRTTLNHHPCSDVSHAYHRLADEVLAEPPILST